MSQRALLVTLDAWKTLFTPREPIAIQYVRVARKHGVVAKESYIASSFEKGKECLRVSMNLGQVARAAASGRYGMSDGEPVCHERVGRVVRIWRHGLD